MPATTGQTARKEDGPSAAANAETAPVRMAWAVARESLPLSGPDNGNGGKEDSMAKHNQKKSRQQREVSEGGRFMARLRWAYQHVGPARARLLKQVPLERRTSKLADEFTQMSLAECRDYVRQVELRS